MKTSEKGDTHTHTHVQKPCQKRSLLLTAFIYFCSVSADEWRNNLRNTKSETLKKSFNRKNQHVISQLRKRTNTQHINFMLQMNDRWNVLLPLMSHEMRFAKLHFVRFVLVNIYLFCVSMCVMCVCLIDLYRTRRTNGLWGNPIERFIFGDASYITNRFHCDISEFVGKINRTKRYENNRFGTMAAPNVIYNSLKYVRRHIIISAVARSGRMFRTKWPFCACKGHSSRIFLVLNWTYLFEGNF